jgi:hypothetical protein
LYAIRCTLERRRDKVALGLISRVRSARDGPEEDLEQALDAIDEGDEEACAAFVRQRTSADLAWERRELDSILEEVRDLSATPSKFGVLLESLLARRKEYGERIRQTVVFTRVFDTLTDIAARLVAVDGGMRLGWYSGPACRYRVPASDGWIDAPREEVSRRFLRGELDVLLCTDAAAEGLNLQTADLLVNYDLPWNPMKVEQRIGRIDRIGQHHDEIQVLNLCYPDSAEQFVYGRLLARLEGIMATVGRQNISLLPVSPREFQELAAGRLPGETLEARVRQRLEDLERRNEAFDIPPAEQYDMYARLAERQALPATLEAAFAALVGSAFLKALGCRIRDVPEGSVLLLGGIAGVAPGAALTDSRALYERGSPELQAELHFATWGEPVFEAVLGAVLEHDAPGCARRLEVAVPGSSATLVGYAVATATGVELVCSLAQLQEPSLDLSVRLTDTQVAPLEAELRALARKEGRSCAVAEWVEAVNEAAGRSEEALHCFAAARLLEYVAPGKAMPLRSALGLLESRLAEHPVVRIPHVPEALARRSASCCSTYGPHPQRRRTSTSICPISCTRFCSMRLAARARRCECAASIRPSAKWWSACGATRSGPWRRGPRSCGRRLCDETP